MCPKGFSYRSPLHKLGKKSTLRNEIHGKIEKMRQQSKPPKEKKRGWK